MDVMLSFLGLVLLSWLMLIIWLLVRVELGKPALYKQERAGYQEKLFYI